MSSSGDERCRVISSWPDAQKFGAAMEKFPWPVRAPPAPHCGVPHRDGLGERPMTRASHNHHTQVEAGFESLTRSGQNFSYGPAHTTSFKMTLWTPQVEHLSTGANRHGAVADWSEGGILAFGADANVALWRPEVRLPAGLY